MLHAATAAPTTVTITPDIFNGLPLVETVGSGSFYALQKEASYIVGKVGSTYTLQNGTSGALQTYNTNSTKIIQWAISNLTAGRTYQQKIVLIGDMGEVHDIEVPSYTFLQGVDAKMTLPAGQNYILKQPASDINYVTIQGISFNGYSKTAGKAIYQYYYDDHYRYAYDVKIKDCVFNTFLTSWECIGERTWFENNKVNDCQYGFRLIYGRDNHIVNNHIYIGDSLATTNCKGGYFVDVKYADVSGNMFRGVTAGTGGTNYLGLYCSGWANYLDIHDNQFSDLYLYGTMLGGESRPTTTVTFNKIHNNIYTRITTGAISIGKVDPCTDIQITDNLMDDVVNALIVGDTGLNIANTRIMFSDNKIRTTTYGFKLYGNAYNVTIQDNEFDALSSVPVIETGTLCLRRNAGISATLQSIFGKVYENADHAIADATTTVLNWTQVTTNYGSVYSAGTPSRLTAPKNGIYHVSANIMWASSTGNRMVYLYLNGVTQIGMSQVAVLPGVNAVEACTTILYMAAGSYVEVKVRQTGNSGPCNVLYNDATASCFSLALIEYS